MANIYKITFTCSLILLIITPLVSTPLSAEEWDFSRWGYAFDKIGNILDTVPIYAWIDGVDYGMDITGTGSDIGYFFLECSSDYLDPNVKEGGINGDIIYYTWGELRNSGSFFAETDIWTAFGFNILPANLTEVGNTPVLLKISKISTAPVPYIGIFDPYGTTNITEFALDINNGGPVQIIASDIMYTIGSLTYIDPTRFGGISNDSALTISEYSTGFIVDRVEFGTINVVPQETILSNAPNPPVGQEIHRTPTEGRDSNDCQDDFTFGPAWSPITATATGPTGNGPADVVLTYQWTGSPASVELLYSENGGPFISAGMDTTVDGLYSWVCPGGPGNTYEWICNVPGGQDDGVGIPGGPPEISPYIVLPSTEIPLLGGWNLVSLPYEQNDTAIGSVLQSIDSKWDCIQTYDPLSPNPWKSTSIFRPDQLNEVSSLDHTMAFWINITEPNVNLTVSGYIPSSTTIPLYAGWNLIGYPTLTEKTVADALWGTGADKVEVFDPAESYRIKEIGPTYMMRPGEGYWVHVPVDTVWIVNW